VRRTEAKAGFSNQTFSLSGNYAFIQAQPLYGYSNDREEVGAGVSLRFAENWRAFASGAYDLETSVLVSDTVGFGYMDECFAYTFTVATNRDRDREDTDERTFGFSISLRTLGDIGSEPGTFLQ